MKLIVLTALIAVCGAAKLDRSYLPPASAQTAGGSDGDLSAPALRSSQNSQGLSVPKGGYTNEHQGIIVDAAAAGTRAAGPVETGLGGPRASYGSEASKVGDAAFRGAAGYRQQNAPNLQQPQGVQNGLEQGPLHVQNGQFSPVATNQGFLPQSYEPQAPLNVRPQAAQDKQANIVRYDSEVGADSFNYAFETDNGIVAEENGVATNGVQAQGGFSYTSDDGQTYSVSYVADENGYQPKGAHLPTPPPIPEEILKSLEKNAQEAANGVVDDGSYDAKKYNGGDYAENANGRYSNEQPNKGSGNGVDVSASGSFVNPNVQQSSEQPRPNADVNQYLPGGQQQAQQNQPPRSQQNNQPQNVGSQTQSYQSQASQRAPIQPQQQQSYNNAQPSALSQPAQPQWSQSNNQQQNVKYQPQIPQQQATRQPWSQQNNSPPQWSQSNNQTPNTRLQYQPQSQIPQQQPQPWSQQNSIQPQNARPQNQQQPQIPPQEEPQPWSQQSSYKPQNAGPQYQPQLQSSQQQPWSQPNIQPETAQAQPEQPQWSQSNNQPQNARPQSYQQPQLPQQQTPQQPWWQTNKNQPQSAQPQWSQANNQLQNAAVQANQQQPQGRPQWSQPKSTQASAQPWSQTNNNQPQGARPAFQQQPLSQQSQPQLQQPQQQGNQQSITASASVNSGSNAFQSSYLPPRINSQNIPARNPIFESTPQPAQQSNQHEPAETPAQIQQLPLTESQLVHENSAQGQDSDIVSSSYQQQQPIETSAHVNVPPPTLAPSFSASAQASVNIGGQRPQYPKPPSLPANHADVEINSTDEPNGDNSAEQEEDDTIDVNKQDGPTAAVPNFIKYGSQSSYEYSSQANHDQALSNNAENQSSQPENPQGLYHYQKPQSYNNQPQITSSQASPTVSSEPLSSSSQESSPATRYPKPPTLAPATVSAIPETDSTSSAGASVENSVSSTPANRYLQPSNPSYPQQTDAIVKPFPQQQLFVQRQSIPQQPLSSQFGQRLRPQPQPYNRQLPQPSSTLQPSQHQQQPNYHQPQSNYIPLQANQQQPQIPQQPQNQQLLSQSPQLQGSQSLPQQISQQPQQTQLQQYNSYQQPISPPQQYQNVQKPTPSSYYQQEQVNLYQYNQPQQPLLEIPQGAQSYQDQQPLNSYQQPLNYQPDAPVLNQSEDSHISSSPNGQELSQYGKPKEQPASNNDADKEILAPQVGATGQPEEETNKPEILQTSDNSQESNPDVKSPAQNQFAVASAGAPEQSYKSPVAGTGEVFDSQRQTPSSSYDDQTGYHY